MKPATFKIIIASLFIAILVVIGITVHQYFKIRDLSMVNSNWRQYHKERVKESEKRAEIEKQHRIDSILNATKIIKIETELLKVRSNEKILHRQLSQLKKFKPSNTNADSSYLKLLNY